MYMIAAGTEDGIVIARGNDAPAGCALNSLNTINTQYCGYRPCRCGGRVRHVDHVCHLVFWFNV